jgi:ABC-type multidrug transport system fused ATPase/permease subunit
VHHDSLTVQASSFVSRSVANIAHLGPANTTSTSLTTGHTTLLWWDLPDANEHPLFYVSVFGIIGSSFAIMGIFSNITQLFGTLRASRELFHRLLFVVVHATFRWHDTTPQGRMLNRFSKDIETIDGSLGDSIGNVNASVANLFASIITVA